MNEQHLLTAWRQSTVPVIFRTARDPSDNQLLVKLPYAEDNRDWLRRGRRKEPNYIRGWKCWQLPRAAFNDLAKRVIQRYGEVILIQPYNEEQKCCSACQNAHGLDCECPCMGANHGKGYAGEPWYQFAGAIRADYHGRAYQVQRIVKPSQAAKAEVP